MYLVMSPKHHSRNFAISFYLLLQQFCKVDKSPIVGIRRLKFKELELAQGYTELLKCSARIQSQIYLIPDLTISPARQGNNCAL